MWPVAASRIVLARRDRSARVRADAFVRIERSLFLVGRFSLLGFWAWDPRLSPSRSAIRRHLGELHAVGHRATGSTFATHSSTGQYFEKFVTEETQWLAPDNFQEDSSTGRRARVHRRPTSDCSCCRSSAHVDLRLHHARRDDRSGWSGSSERWSECAGIAATS